MVRARISRRDAPRSTARRQGTTPSSNESLLRVTDRPGGMLNIQIQLLKARFSQNHGPLATHLAERTSLVVLRRISVAAGRVAQYQSSRQSVRQARNLSGCRASGGFADTDADAGSLADGKPQHRHPPFCGCKIHLKGMPSGAEAEDLHATRRSRLITGSRAARRQLAAEGSDSTLLVNVPAAEALAEASSRNDEEPYQGSSGGRWNRLNIRLLKLACR